MPVRLQSIWSTFWYAQHLRPDVTQYMLERYLLHGMLSLKYSLAGGLLLVIFELNPNNITLLGCWTLGFIVIQAFHYFSLKQAMIKLTARMLWQIYLLGVVVIAWWMVFLFVFGWYEESAFTCFWRGAIIFIVMVFYLDAMQYGKKFLLLYTFITCLGLLVYLHGFTSVPSDAVARMSVSIVFGCVALLMSGLASLTLNLEVANLFVNHKNSIVELDEIASRDSLTKLYNRRYFDLHLQRHLDLYHQNHQGFCLAMMDIDFFKNINDVYGHQVGDTVLVKVADYMKIGLRDTDILARYGGEEFVMLLTTNQLEAASKTMNKLRIVIEQTPFLVEGKPVKLTASFGITLVKQGDTVTSIFERTDRAMYQAKHNGRNTVVKIV